MASVIRGSDNFDSGSIASLGEGQTWQDVKASRAFNVTYTNTENRAILISMSNNTDDRAGMYIYVDNLPIGSSYIDAGYGRDQLMAVVPSGSTYKVTSSDTSIQYWTELR